MVEQIDKAQQRLVVDRNHDYLKLAGELFERAFDPPDIRFDLRGGSAGMFRVRGGETCLRYNPWLFAKYFEENLASTVPHEVAHFVVYRVFGHLRVRPHGREWRLLMEAFGAEPRVTGNYDLSGVPHRRQRRFEYHCGCRTHWFSTRRHNLVAAGSAYRCRTCGGPILSAGDLSGD